MERLLEFLLMLHSYHAIIPSCVLSCRKDASLKKRSIIGEVAEAEVHTLVPLFFRKEIHGVAESWPEVSPGPL